MDRSKRLSSMGGPELRDRIRQHVMARADALRYRAGLGFGEESVAGSQSGRRFFFSTDAVIPLCKLLKQLLPEASQAILRQAEQVCQHRFDLLGYEGLDYGTRIDWHRDRVHQKTAPRKPWYQIPYLDFEQVGDSKVTWELNRHQHFVNLAKAYRLSGNEKFATEIFAQWRHWHAENPYPIGINWASSLEVAFRSLSWIWTYLLLKDSAVVPSGFRQEWLRALSISGRHIECYLSTYFSPNTHLLGEGVALFFIGLLCPELRSARRWQKLGWDVTLRESERQVSPDGLHFEQSTYYHVYALDFFLHAGVLANLNDLPVPASFDATLEKMLQALALLVRAGTPPRFGDDDGGRLFDPRRNRTEHLADPLATGAVLFGRGDFKALSGGLREETLWLLGEEGAKEFERLPVKTTDAGSAALPSAGLYFMAGEGQQLVVDAGPQGATTAGHGHADALSLCLNVNGTPLLIDPGTCAYVREDRSLFRGTPFHNTVVVDKRGQAQPKGPFSWTRLPRVQREGWITGQTFDLFVGSHDGYAPVIHRRWVFSLKSRFWMVRDLILGEGEHTLDVCWHLNPQLFEKNRAFVDALGRAALEVLSVENSEWRREIQSGWWSPVYGKKEPAPVLHFGTVANLPAEFVTLLLAEPARAEVDKLTRVPVEDTKAHVYRYASKVEEHQMIFGGHAETWAANPWTSDAEFLYVGRRGEQAHFILCNGSFLAVNEKKIFSAPHAVLRCEILVSPATVEVYCSDKNAVVMKDSAQKIWQEQGDPPTASASRGTVS
jgi:hypothetical protein